LLSDKNIICELCIQSNLLTKAVQSLEEYGKLLRTFDEFGVRYTFSTDSPALQLTTLAGEIESLLLAGSATPEQIRRAFTNANEATFIR